MPFKLYLFSSHTQLSPLDGTKKEATNGRNPAVFVLPTCLWQIEALFFLKKEISGEGSNKKSEK